MGEAHHAHLGTHEYQGVLEIDMPVGSVALLESVEGRCFCAPWDCGPFTAAGIYWLGIRGNRVRGLDVPVNSVVWEPKWTLSDMVVDTVLLWAAPTIIRQSTPIGIQAKYQKNPVAIWV